MRPALEYVWPHRYRALVFEGLTPKMDHNTVLRRNKAAFLDAVNVADHSTIYKALEPQREHLPEAALMLALYELFGLNGKQEVDQGLKQLAAIDDLATCNAFQLIASLADGFTQYDQPDLARWTAAIEELAGKHPHLAMAILGAINAGRWSYRLLPTLARSVMYPGLEFGQRCLWGLTPGLPISFGRKVVDTVRAHDNFRSIPYEDAWGIADSKNNDLGFVGLGASRIDALCLNRPLASLDELEQTISESIGKWASSPSDLRFAPWQDYGDYRRCIGAMIMDDAGIRFDIIGMKKQKAQKDETDISRCAGYDLSQQVILFIPTSAADLLEEANEALENGREARLVRWSDQAIDINREKRQRGIDVRQRYIDKLAHVCTEHGLTDAVCLIAAVDAKNRRQCDDLGEKVFRAISNDKNSASLPADDWFEDPDCSYAVFVEMMAGLTQGNLPIENISSELSGDQGIERVTFELDGDEVKLRGDRSWGTIHPDFIRAFFESCDTAGSGRFVASNTSELLDVAYLPREVADVLINTLYEFRR